MGDRGHNRHESKKGGCGRFTEGGELVTVGSGVLGVVDTRFGVSQPAADAER